MALRSGYKGFKKLLGLKTIRPGTLAVDDAALANTFFPRSEQEVLGAKNLLPNKGTSTTADGITWTVNADGTVQANGTKDNNNNGFKTLDRVGDNYRLPSGRYVLSGNASSACTLMLQATRNGQLVQLGQVMGSDTEAVVDILSTDVLQCVLFVNAEQTVNNVIFYPMLRLATDTDPTYVPFAMTNRELTEKVQGIIDAATNAADFAAFKTAMGAITPVTRSLSMEVFPEEEPAEVIEEKTTKKTTKKTTVKEGE